MIVTAGLALATYVLLPCISLNKLNSAGYTAIK